MLVMAIDPNSKTGIAEGKLGGTPTVSLVRFRHHDEDTVEDIFQRVTFHFAQRFRDNVPDYIFIEAPVPPSQVQGATNFNTSLITLGVYAIIVGVAKCKGIDIRRAQIASWRKAVLGSGRLKGVIAKKAASDLCQRLGWQAEDHNAAEAACIWMYGCIQVAPYGVTTLHPALFPVRAA